MQGEENVIKISVRGKVAELTEMNFELVGGNSDYKVIFDFDEEWEKYPAKTILFVYGKNTIKRVVDGNVCDGVAIEKSSICLIGAYSGDLATTTPARVQGIKQSIRDVATDLPQAPEADVYNQIMELLQKAIYAHTELPVGGKKGQVLKKKSAEDYDTEWADADGRKSEWDFVIDSPDKLSEISEMYGNVLISYDVLDEDSIGIDVPKAVTYLKMDISTYSDYAVSYVKGHSECTLEGRSFGRSGAISGFREVRNVGVTDGTISNCGFVYNCTALDFINCNYVELADFAESGGNEGTSASISKCRHICHINYGRSSANLYISNCDVVENIDGDDFGAELTITNAKTVDTVSGFASATYENCKYVNPQTCQDYVTQQGAVGKVQVLTADGSFEAVGFGSGGVDDETSQRITDLENAVYGVEEELEMLNEGGIE